MTRSIAFIFFPTLKRTQKDAETSQHEPKRLKRTMQSTGVNLIRAQIAPEDLEYNERRLRSLLLEVSDHVAAQGKVKRPELRYTGGWVRDKLLGGRSNDIDVSITTMTGFDFAKEVQSYSRRKEVMARYGEDALGKTAKIEANPEMSKHLETATVKFWKDLEVDFVNTRTETYCEDSRTPQMQYGSPREDAERRDATINALFYNLDSSQVEDFTGRGIHDLENHVIKTPLEAERTFKDDPLRVLRHIRFASRFGFEIDPEDRTAMSNDVIREALRTKITRERVFKEIEKALKGMSILDLEKAASSFRQVLIRAWRCNSLTNSVFTRSYLQSRSMILVLQPFLRHGLQVIAHLAKSSTQGRRMESVTGSK